MLKVHKQLDYDYSYNEPIEDIVINDECPPDFQIQES